VADMTEAADKANDTDNDWQTIKTGIMALVCQRPQVHSLLLYFLSRPICSSSAKRCPVLAMKLRS